MLSFGDLGVEVDVRALGLLGRRRPKISSPDSYGYDAWIFFEPLTASLVSMLEPLLLVLHLDPRDVALVDLGERDGGVHLLVVAAASEDGAQKQGAHDHHDDPEQRPTERNECVPYCVRGTSRRAPRPSRSAVRRRAWWTCAMPGVPGPPSVPRAIRRRRRARTGGPLQNASWSTGVPNTFEWSSHSALSVIRAGFGRVRVVRPDRSAAVDLGLEHARRTAGPGSARRSPARSRRRTRSAMSKPTYRTSTGNLHRLRLAEQRHHLDRGRVPAAEVPEQPGQRQPRVDDVLDDQHVPAADVPVQVLEDPDHARRAGGRRRTTRPP